MFDILMLGIPDGRCLEGTYLADDLVCLYFSNRSSGCVRVIGAKSPVFADERGTLCYIFRNVTLRHKEFENKT